MTTKFLVVMNSVFSLKKIIFVASKYVSEEIFQRWDKCCVEIRENWRISWYISMCYDDSNLYTKARALIRKKIKANKYKYP